MIPVTDPSKQAEQDRLAAEVAAFLAKGGQIQRLRQGQVAHNGVPMKRTALPSSSQVAPGIAPTPPESVPITGVHRIPNTRRNEPPLPRTASAVRAAQETKSTPSPTPKRTGNFKGRTRPDYVPGSPKTKNHSLLDQLRKGWQSAQELAEALGHERGATLTRLWLLRDKKLVISHGEVMERTWALAGTPLPVGEFDHLDDQLLAEEVASIETTIRDARLQLLRFQYEQKRRRKA